MSTADLDAKLTELLRVMVSRLPADKKLSPAVVQQLLRTKYGDIYPDAYVASHTEFIAQTIESLTAAKNNAGGDDDSDDDEEDDEDDSGSDEEEDDDEDEEEESESDFDSDSESDGDEEEDEETEEGAAKKRARIEEEKAFAAVAAPVANGGESVGTRCKAMVECLKKLSYRVRPPAEGEALDDYLHKYLVAEFQKRDMDPERYGKEDVRRYKVRREVEELQQDGASLSLSKSARAGRGYTGVRLPGEAEPVPKASAYQTSKFLDDEE